MKPVRCVALSGGVGGAKLALGLCHAMDPQELLLVANTGDDFEHLGFQISPDIDTLVYTLAELANPETGWGRGDETWSFMETLGDLGGETWFRLGDRDLALHAERTQRLRQGEGLASVTDSIRRKLGVKPRIVPMSDDPVRTIVQTPDGPLAFQHYFVREQCTPRVTGFSFEGSESAHPNRDFLAALAEAEAVVICPSNPFISIDPILALRGVRDTLAACAAPVIAVSPIVGGQAIKGPTAKMMAELGLGTSAVEVAQHYRNLIDGFVLDTVDADSATEVEEAGPRVLVTNTVMNSLADRVSLAREVLSFANKLRGG